MKLSKKKEAAVMEVYTAWWESYLNGDVATYDAYLAEDYRFVGSTDGEEYLNRADTTAFFEKTADQMAGKAVLRNLDRNIDPLKDGLVLITDLADAYVLSDAEWVYYSRFRFSSLMRNTKDGWRFIYQHFSAPDSKAQEGETLGLEKISRENQELRDAIKRRTAELEHKNRELEIETALERVRAKTMAMHSSAQLAETALELYQQFAILGDLPDRISIAIFKEDANELELWPTDQTGHKLDQPFKGSLDGNPVIKKVYKAWKSAADSIVVDLRGKDLEEWLRYIRKELKLYVDDTNIKGRRVQQAAFFSHGMLLLTTNEPIAGSILQLLIRFAKVFSQTYTRFLDLKKAEEQAREAQIEAALERVRSKTMAMHNSEDVGSTVVTLFDEVLKLGLDNSIRCGIGVLQNNDRMETWSATLDKKRNVDLVTGMLNMTIHPLLIGTINAWKNKEPGYSYELIGEEVVNYYRGLNNEPDYPFHVDLATLPERIYNRSFCFSEGILFSFTSNPLSEEAAGVLQRFAGVFGQTYRRYLDLKKAEEQGREAQIEAALERVRSKAIAMHKSEELLAVIEVVSEQLLQLDLTFDTISFGTNSQEGDFKFWLTSTGQPKPVLMNVPPLDSRVQKSVIEAQKKGIDFIADIFSKEENREWCEHLIRHSELKNFPETVKQYILNSPGFARSSFLEQHIALYVGNYRAVPFSDEENAIFKRFAQVFAQAYTRFLDLQKAEAQVREAQIEAALERVRSKTMAMHNSDDVSDTVIALFEEVLKLGLDPSIRCGIGIVMGKYKMETWSVTFDKENKVDLKMGMLNMNIHPLLLGVMKSWETGSHKYTYALKGKEVIEYYKAINDEPDYPFYADLETLPGQMINTTFFFSAGILFSFTEQPLTEEASNVLNRFAKVFDQTYTRYLDLKKAEEQAQEARVEASLERVRSKAMAMHNSKDLPETASVIFEELRNHGINPMRCGISLHNRDNRKNLLYTATRSAKGEHLTLVGWAILDDHPVLSEIYDSWLRGEDYFPVLKGALLKSYYQKIQSSFAVPKEQQKGEQHGFFIAFSHGVIYGWGKHPVDENERKLLKRFASVADLTFNRYFDLQKAEAQTREAQIEAALERIRARALAMHSSNELTDVANVLREQMGHLNQPELETSSVHLYHRNTKLIESWFAFRSPGKTSGKFQNGTAHIPFESSAVSRKWAKLFFSDKTEYTVKIEGEELEEWLRVREKETPAATYKKGDTPATLYSHFSKFSGGALVMVTLVEPGEVSKLLQKRAAVVFDLAYKRFLDLQKSEAQAAEAIKQASLDRVRGEIASMRSTEDLQRITPLVFNELTTLGVPFIRCGVFIITEKTKTVEAYLSAPDGHTLAVMKLPFHVNEVTANTVKFWRKAAVYTVHWDRDEFLEWTESLIEQGFIKNKKKYLDADIPPESLDLHFIPFTQGMLYVGNERPLQKAEIDLAKSLADAFAIAYARYEDFVHLEKAKERTELALNELKATQNQLVQSEKMASLGELTAGIAHEIKNPLNFVNNFSEVTVELIEEMEEEMQRGAEGEVKALASDIRQNLEKILHHGRRADSIVKGMLQHSRASSGKKERTDINVLCDEYLRLAYHGLRARDKSFNARMVTEFDGDIGEINIVPQEIGRVILNLLTNAFYAVTERARQNLDHFDPTVSVKTMKEGNMVIIAIEDNGNGIPKVVKEKIFQPFFTTKPTGQGTGLGLSLSYDIVTKGHGGSLEVRSEEGKGTIFRVLLPFSGAT